MVLLTVALVMAAMMLAMAMPAFAANSHAVQHACGVNHPPGFAQNHIPFCL